MQAMAFYMIFCGDFEISCLLLIYDGMVKKVMSLFIAPLPHLELRSVILLCLPFNSILTSELSTERLNLTSKHL